MILDWPGCDNARDLGGLPTHDGARILPGALLRAGHLGGLTPAALGAIRAAGVSRVVDLRWHRELAADPSPFAGDPIYAHVPLLMDELDYEFTDDSYGPLLDHNREHVAAGFRALALAPPGGVLVHCNAGRDRTGTLVALALGVAGVAPRAIAEDYALTAGCAADTMLNTLAHADLAYGGVEAYLLSIGVSRGQVDAVRTRLRSRPAVR
ncbi:tyrosine-protein phosphatase [Actinoplanes sp. NPDC026623]|uniref:tyrosine-protein phosphatase n=1 Tax=Actinoplanes sp. NPDC026623 TaxID=3155610 RepID=UPI0033EB1E06